MLTDPARTARPAGRAHLGASDSASADRAVPIERSTDIPAGAPATFSRIMAEYRLSAAVDMLIEQLPVGVLVAEQRGRVVYRNAAARQLGIDGLAPVRWALTQALLTEDPVREDALEVRQPDGLRGWFRFEVTPVRDADGAVTGAVLTLADATAGRQLAEWRPVMESLMNL